MADTKLTYLPGEGGGLPQGFCDRFWGGARIEPRSRMADIGAGLEARIADPVWMLARQWQMGEFKGEDNGSPVRVELEYETEILDGVARLPAGNADGHQPTRVGSPAPFELVGSGAAIPPLETVVERERTPLDWRTRVQIGQQFERLLRRAVGDNHSQIANQLIFIYRQADSHFCIGAPENLAEIDYATQRFLRLMRGRAIDGGKLLEAHRKGESATLPAGFEAYAQEVSKALGDLVAWYGLVCNQPPAEAPGFWKPRELEYEFALTGSEYPGVDELSVRPPIIAKPEEPSPPTIAEPGIPAPPTVAEPSPPVGPPTLAEASQPAGLPPPPQPGHVLRQVSSAGSQADVTKVEPAGAPLGVAPDASGPIGVDTGVTPSSAAGPHAPRCLRTQLVALDYRSGDLDWYSCDVGTVEETAAPREVHRLTLNPSRVAFAGKPNERWWAFEDANLNFAELDRGTPNLGRLFILEFALVHADDWYLIPLELPLGSITRIRSLYVYDVFGLGGSERIEPALEVGESEQDTWQLFTLADARASQGGVSGPALFLPPSLGDREESPPIEEVRFVRDEGANMVFAIEKALRNGLGNPVDGPEAHRERRDRERRRKLEDCEWELTAVEARLSEPGVPDVERLRLEQDAAALRTTASRLRGKPSAAPPTEGLPLYRLASPVPDEWVPYVPKKVPESLQAAYGATAHSIRLRQAKMVRGDDLLGPTENSPLGHILSDREMRWLNEESVPRAGVKIQLTRQRVRWMDGTTYVWIGRRVLTGRGERASGLRFDVVSERGV